MLLARDQIESTVTQFSFDQLKRTWWGLHCKVTQINCFTWHFTFQNIHLRKRAINVYPFDWNDEGMMLIWATSSLDACSSHFLARQSGIFNITIPSPFTGIGTATLELLLSILIVSLDLFLFSADFLVLWGFIVVNCVMLHTQYYQSIKYEVSGPHSEYITSGMRSTNQPVHFKFRINQFSLWQIMWFDNTF